MPLYEQFFFLKASETFVAMLELRYQRPDIEGDVN